MNFIIKINNCLFNNIYLEREKNKNSRNNILNCFESKLTDELIKTINIFFIYIENERMCIINLNLKKEKKIELSGYDDED